MRVLLLLAGIVPAWMNVAIHLLGWAATMRRMAPWCSRGLERIPKFFRKSHARTVWTRHLFPDRQSSLFLRPLALKVRGVIRIAAAFVLRCLRIRAQRPRHLRVRPV